MLVLSRKQTEKIVIGGGIVITVVKILGTKVQIGIEAPRGTTIHRAEVHEAIVRQEKEKGGET